MGLLNTRIRQHKNHRIETEEEFQKLVENQRRRSTRSNRPSVLVTLRLPASTGGSANKSKDACLNAVLSALRDTDRIGWLQVGSIGVLCTETGDCDAETAGASLTKRLGELLNGMTTVPELGGVRISFTAISPATFQERKPEPAEAEPLEALTL